MTKIEIIEETVAFYSEDVNRRALMKDAVAAGIYPRCAYITEDGRRCAVGRCLTKESAEKLQRSNNDVDTYKDLDEHLLFQYRGHVLEFWVDLQHLHDTDKFWDESGLTVAGTDELNKILRKWNQ